MSEDILLVGDGSTAGPLICVMCKGEITPGSMVRIVPGPDTEDDQRVFSPAEVLVAHDVCPEGSGAGPNADCPPGCKAQISHTHTTVWPDNHPDAPKED